MRSPHTDTKIKKISPQKFKFFENSQKTLFVANRETISEWLRHSD